MKLKTAGIILGVAIALGIVFAMFAPMLVEDAVESELHSRLDRAGVYVRWDSFSSTFGRSFRLRGVNFSAPSRGVSGSMDDIVVTISIDRLLDRKFSLKAIDIDGARVGFDIDSLAVHSDTGTRRSSGPNSGSFGPKSSLARRLLESPPEVTISNATAIVVRGNEGLLQFSTTETSVELNSKSIDLIGDAKIEFLHSSMRRLDKPIEAAFSASYDMSVKNLEASLRNRDSERPLVSWDLEDLGALRLGEVAVTASLPDESVEFAIDLLSLRIGKREAPALAIEAPLLQLGYRNQRPSITSTGARISITPSQSALVSALIASTSSGSSDVKSVNPFVMTNAWGGRLRKVSHLMAQTDLKFRGVRVDINLEDDSSGDLTKLTLIERLDGAANAGHVNARGTSAGGTFYLDIDMLPGESIPRYVSIDIDKVDLSNIPGMPKARSELPSTGTSGRVGGVLSANLLWQMPMKGLALSQLYDTAHGQLSVTWEEGVVDLVGVSEEPVAGIEFASKADFTWSPLLARLDIENGKLNWGPIDTVYSGFVQDFPMDTTFQVQANVKEIDCQKAIRSLPAAMLGPYRNIKFEGAWAPSILFYLPVYRPRALRLEIDGYEDLCKPTAMLVPKGMRPQFVNVIANAPTGPHKSVRPDEFDGPILSDVFWLNRPFIKRVTEGVSSEEVDIRVGPGLASYVPLEQLPPWVGGAAYLSEEMMFYSDPGISLGLIKKALRLNLEKGRFVYGGSTVTQQLVKNLFLTREKTLSRKLQEALLAWRITNEISKDRVLELYLNCIEFGPDIYGIGPAAEYYFQKDARDLSPLEAIFLAMLKPNPLYGARVIQRKKTPEGGWWTNRMDEMFERLKDRGMITDAQVQAEKPYVLRWDADGRYIDRKKSLIPLLP